MGIAEVMIILGIIIATSFIFRMIRLSRSINPVPTSEPQQMDWYALNDPELQSYLPDQKINAIKRYRELTNVGLKDAKEAIEYAVAHPEGLKKGKSLSGQVVDTDGAGVRDLIADGRIEEAVDVYAAFMGIDEYSARAAIERMQREDSAGSRLSNASMDEVSELLMQGNKINAIKRYRELTGLGLKEAKDAIDQMERDS